MLQLRLATVADEPVMRELMNRAIAELLKPYLPRDGVTASFETPRAGCPWDPG